MPYSESPASGTLTISSSHLAFCFVALKTEQNILQASDRKVVPRGIRVLENQGLLMGMSVSLNFYHFTH
jgi:hypothetical protein